MPSVAAPFGMKPIVHQSSGSIRQVVGTIASGYSSTIYRYAPVKMLADGTIGVAAVGDSIVGVFLGCQFTETTGARKVQNHWPASTSATEIEAYYTNDPSLFYKIQSAGSVAQTAVGELADLAASPGAGSTVTGYSTAALSATTATTPATLQIMAIDKGPDNAAGDTATNVIVRIMEHQLVAALAAGV